MIKVLDKKVADKIAAGEVVERPLSVVKELIENAIDADSTKIIIELKDGGKEYIRVTDNGIGIAPDECLTAFLRHATSKITTADDLNQIQTLGFRGEALASIAAVSRTELLTKQADNKLGRQVVIEGGDVTINNHIGTADGTTIIVRDLFYNTPARLKFLKSSKSESSLVIRFVTEMALAYPNIQFRMINNGNILFATNGKNNRLNTIATLTSPKHIQNLIPFNYEQDGIFLEGYVSNPSESRKTRKEQVFFVNGRVIDSKIIEKGITNAYADRLFEGRFPICYLFLNIDPASMDVNIHPNKRQVRFFDEELVTNIVQRAIITALNTETGISHILPKRTSTDEVTKVLTAPKRDVFKLHGDNNNSDKTTTYTFNQNNTQIPQAQRIAESNISDEYISNTTTSCEKTQNAFKDIKDTLSNYKTSKKDQVAIDIKNQIISEQTDRFDFTKLEVKGQYFNTYIQLTDEDNIYFLDQHAAHERVYYEKLLHAYNTGEKLTQPILMPFTINVSLADKEREEDWLPFLNEIGYVIEEFGSTLYKIIEIPMFFDMSHARDFLQGYVDNIGSIEDFHDEIMLNKLATRACKAAVKANDVLSLEEINALLQDMSNCNNPYSCPHGRPTFIKLTKYDIERQFKRK